MITHIGLVISPQDPPLKEQSVKPTLFFRYKSYLYHLIFQLKANNLIIIVIQSCKQLHSLAYGSVNSNQDRIDSLRASMGISQHHGNNI